MPDDRRLDTELVRRGLARSREHAVSLIRDGAVHLDGNVASKASVRVSPQAPVRLGEQDAAQAYVSRAARKLDGALAEFSDRSGPIDFPDAPGLSVRGRRCLDAGASTGGFTQVLLGRGAHEVVAVDVGHDQLATELRNDPRVRLHEGVNVRDLRPGQIGGTVDLVVADLSFISLTLVLPALAEVCVPGLAGADMLVMVKPQFEVGRDRVGSGGVVRHQDLRVDSVWQVAVAAATHGWGVTAMTTSALPGTAGNVEYFLWLQPGTRPPDRDRIATAVTKGRA
ncbi:MAG TPA: TlyA family RNA methyltransferase [Jiangellaceae bacterium]|nr:TlyA family RNA methyltransferase [Jiangellaceae bacterium]